MKKTMRSEKDHRQEPTDTLDTETSFADMNVEGMPWYEPERRGNGEKGDVPQLSKSEQRAMMKGALLAFLPFIGGLILLLAILFALAWLWLR